MSSYRDEFYRDPAIYDLEYRRLTEDIDHYMGLARDAGRVLELGAGTGRLTLPMARTGAEVVALDLSRAMLGRLEERLAEESDLDVTPIHGDFRMLEVDGTFPLVTLPFNAIHHLFDAAEVTELFQAVQRHLDSGGRFALDMLVPDFRFFERDPDGVYELRRDKDPDGGEMRSWENGWYDPIAQINHVRYHFERGDGRTQTVEVPMRMWYPQEILGLIRQARWRLLRCDQDFQGTPLGPHAKKLVLLLGKRG